MMDNLEMLFACGIRDFEYINGIYVKKSEPPQITKLYSDSDTAFEEISGLGGGRLVTNLSFPTKKRRYLLYRLDTHVPYPAPSVTEATEFDGEGLSSLFQLMYLSTEGVAPPREAADFFALNKFRNTAVIRENGKAVAMGRIAFRGEKYGRINTVAVAPECRGRGLAKAIVCALSSSLISLGLIPTVLAYDGNASANALYNSLGFTAVGELYEYILSSDLCENSLIMNTLN